MIECMLHTNYITINIINCTFLNNNDWKSLIFVYNTKDDCLFSTNVILQNSKFEENKSPVLNFDGTNGIQNDGGECKINVHIVGPIDIAHNRLIIYTP